MISGQSSCWCWHLRIQRQQDVLFWRRPRRIQRWTWTKHNRRCPWMPHSLLRWNPWAVRREPRICRDGFRLQNPFLPRFRRIPTDAWSNHEIHCVAVLDVIFFEQFGVCESFSFDYKPLRISRRGGIVSCRELRFDRGNCIGWRDSESVRGERFKRFKCQRKSCATFSGCGRSFN